jgi:hypothetical protein
MCLSVGRRSTGAQAPRGSSVTAGVCRAPRRQRPSCAAPLEPSFSGERGRVRLGSVRQVRRCTPRRRAPVLSVSRLSSQRRPDQPAPALCRRWHPASGQQGTGAGWASQTMLLVANAGVQDVGLGARRTSTAYQSCGSCSRVSARLHGWAVEGGALAKHPRPGPLHQRVFHLTTHRDCFSVNRRLTAR